MDITYITLNILIMLMNFYDVMMLEYGDSDSGIKLFTPSWFINPKKGSIHIQRKLAAVSTFLIWIRFYDWLKLFKHTAFYLVLIKNTIYYSLEFIVIILTSLMAFGSFVYFLNIDKHPEDEIMTSRFGFGLLDIFQNQYEQSLGEFNLEYEQSIEKEILTVVFTVATFYIIIVLLNMLIAIMGDIYERAVDERV